jgi:Protein of unknown function (DUF3703)
MSAGDNMPYFAGSAIALVVALSATFVGLDKDRAFYPTVMAVIASTYVLFAAMGGSDWTVVMELFIMAAFLVAVVLGFKRNLWLIVAAMSAHGLLDLFHGHVVSNPGVPIWWPGFCSTYDISAAIYLALRLRTAARPHRRNRPASTRSFGQRICPFVQAELDAARRAAAQHDAAGEFACLERAHVLAQSDTLQHVRVHAAMLLWGIRQRCAHEVFGQLVRIVGAATKTVVGLVPQGNTGGTNVSALSRMPVPPDLRHILDTARR